MSSEECLAYLVKLGTHHSDGTLTEHNGPRLVPGLLIKELTIAKGVGEDKISTEIDAIFAPAAA